MFSGNHTLLITFCNHNYHLHPLISRGERTVPSGPSNHWAWDRMLHHCKPDHTPDHTTFSLRPGAGVILEYPRRPMVRPRSGPHAPPPPPPRAPPPPPPPLCSQATVPRGGVGRTLSPPSSSASYRSPRRCGSHASPPPPPPPPLVVKLQFPAELVIKLLGKLYLFRYRVVSL